MKKIFTCCLLSVVYCFSTAQTTTFQKTFGGTSIEEGFSPLLQTNDGGFVIGGGTASFTSGGYDGYMVKTDSDGNMLWTKTFGGSVNDESISSVQQTNDGGFILTGWAESFGTGGYQDFYLIKTASDGNLQWSKIYGGTEHDIPHSVQQIADGGFIILGLTYNFGAGSSDMYLVKTDSNGSLQWTKTFGGTGDDEGYSLLQTTDGGFILSGWTNSFGSIDAFVLKTMSDGTMQWAKTYSNNYGGYMQPTADGGFIIGCTAIGVGAGNYDMCLLKITSDGSFQWSKAYGGSDLDGGGYAIQTTDGGFILSGNTYSFGAGGGGFDSYFLKTDIVGNLLWSKNYGGTEDDLLDIKQINDGFMGAGFTCSFGTFDIYMVKMDSTGSSGCNEGTPNTIVTTVTTTVTDVTSQVQVSSGGIETTPLTIVGSGGTETMICSTVGVQDLTMEKDLFSKIYPNPAHETFSVEAELSKPGEVTVSVLNLLGETLLQTNERAVTGTFRKQINVKQLVKGIYFVKIKTEEGNVVRKMMVQ